MTELVTFPKLQMSDSKSNQNSRGADKLNKIIQNERSNLELDPNYKVILKCRLINNETIENIIACLAEYKPIVTTDNKLGQSLKQGRVIILI